MIVWVFYIWERHEKDFAWKDSVKGLSAYQYHWTHHIKYQTSALAFDPLQMCILCAFNKVVFNLKSWCLSEDEKEWHDLAVETSETWKVRSATKIKWFKLFFSVSWTVVYLTKNKRTFVLLTNGAFLSFKSFVSGCLLPCINWSPDEQLFWLITRPLVNYKLCSVRWSWRQFSGMQEILQSVRYSS